jgi:carboxylesterase type B
VFGNLGGFGGTDGPEAKALHELMSSYWVNFAKNSDPNGDGLPEWPEFDEKEQQVMYLDGESGARKHSNLEKLMTFDAYYAKLRKNMKTEQPAL